MSVRFPRVAALPGAAGLRGRLEELGCPLPCDDEILSAPDSPLADSLALPPSAPGDSTKSGTRVGNRWVIQPMEGWDGTREGLPTELTRRRWRRFGQSGAGWIWGGEAVAVRADGRANPHQLLIDENTAAAIGAMRRELIARLEPSLALLEEEGMVIPTAWIPEGTVIPASPDIDEAVKPVAPVIPAELMILEWDMGLTIH